jgi:hypothetical protein
MSTEFPTEKLLPDHQLRTLCHVLVPKQTPSIMFLMLTLCALIGASVATPKSKSLTCTTYTDTYEDLTANAISPALSPISTYHGLQYRYWDIKVRT